MELTNNAKATIAFSGAIICFSIVFLGAVLVRYAYRGYGELATT